MGNFYLSKGIQSLSHRLFPCDGIETVIQIISDGAPFAYRRFCGKKAGLTVQKLRGLIQNRKYFFGGRYLAETGGVCFRRYKGAVIEPVYPSDGQNIFQHTAEMILHLLGEVLPNVHVNGNCSTGV
jgi:hypothetical protein